MRYNYLAHAMYSKRGMFKLTKMGIAKLIEVFVNDPSINMEKLGEMFGIGKYTANNYVNEFWFYKRESPTTTTRVFYSKINEPLIINEAA